MDFGCNLIDVLLDKVGTDMGGAGDDEQLLVDGAGGFGEGFLRHVAAVGDFAVIHLLEHEVAVASDAVVRKIDHRGVAAVGIILLCEVTALVQDRLPKTGGLDVLVAVPVQPCSRYMISCFCVVRQAMQVVSI